MKELYSFKVERQIEKEVPHVKKTKDGPVETTKKVKKKIKNRIVFTKPSISRVEDAEFFYGQQYNQYINAGFLTKAMLAKKMGDLGGLTSKTTEQRMQRVVVDSMDSSRTIEFFAGTKDLNEEQKEQLQEAKEMFASSRIELHEYESALRSQFSQTADSKAEVKVIEWFVLNFSYFEEELEGGKKELFPIFEGDDYDEKRNFMLGLMEPDEDIEDATYLRSKNLYKDSFETLIRVASIWYNKIAEDQESIGKSLKDLFPVDEE